MLFNEKHLWTMNLWLSTTSSYSANCTLALFSIGYPTTENPYCSLIKRFCIPDSDCFSSSNISSISALIVQCYTKSAHLLCNAVQMHKVWIEITLSQQSSRSTKPPCIENCVRSYSKWFSRQEHAVDLMEEHICTRISYQLHKSAKNWADDWD